MISTTVTLFVETNIFVYLVDGSDEAKAFRAEQILEDASIRIVVSPQVMGELSVTLKRKLSGVLSDDEIEEHIRSLAPRCSASLDQELALRAIETSRRRQLSYWNSLINETARDAGCERIATEDLSYGAVIRGVEIWNPFVDVT